MGVLVLGREREEERGLRPLDVLRDLDGIGRLIDIAFADDIAQEGSQFLQELTFLTIASPAMWALRRISADMRDAFDGYVWIEDGRVVGNVTLTRDEAERRVWTISNVAVHPDHRRRSIARSLMEATLDTVADRGGGLVVLQVKADNRAAYDLYTRLGFRLVDGVVTTRFAGRLTAPLPLAARARRLGDGEGGRLFELLRSARHADAERIRPLRLANYSRSLWRRLLDAGEDTLRQEQRVWLAVGSSDMEAAARVHTRQEGGNTIDITIRPDRRGQVEEAIVHSALAACATADRAITAHVRSQDEHVQALLQELGFQEVRHLHRLMYEVEEDKT
jgi:ribosomal protein S18 acetylase RimI-like enzyme